MANIPSGVPLNRCFDGYEEIANDGHVSIGYFLGMPYKCHLLDDPLCLIPCSEGWFYCDRRLIDGRWLTKDELVF